VKKEEPKGFKHSRKAEKENQATKGERAKGPLAGESLKNARRQNKNKNMSLRKAQRVRIVRDIERQYGTKKVHKKNLERDGHIRKKG